MNPDRGLSFSSVDVLCGTINDSGCTNFFEASADLPHTNLNPGQMTLNPYGGVYAVPEGCPAGQSYTAYGWKGNMISLIKSQRGEKSRKEELDE